MQRPVTRRGVGDPFRSSASSAQGLTSQQSHQNQQQCQQLTLEHSAASISLSDLGTPLLQQQKPTHDLRISRPQHKQLRVQQVQDGLPAAPGAYAAVVSTARTPAHVLHVHDSSAQPGPAAELSGLSESFLSLSSSDIQIVHSAEELIMTAAAAAAEASYGSSGAGQHTHKQPQQQRPLVTGHQAQPQHQLSTRSAAVIVKHSQPAAAMLAQRAMHQHADETYSDDGFEEASQASLPAAAPFAIAQHSKPPSAAAAAAAAGAAAAVEPNRHMPGHAAPAATVCAADTATAGAAGAFVPTAGAAQAPTGGVSQQFDVWEELEQLHRSLPLATMIRRASSSSSSSSSSRTSSGGSTSSSRARRASVADSSKSSSQRASSANRSQRTDSSGAVLLSAAQQAKLRQPTVTAGTQQQHLHVPRAPAVPAGSGSSSTAMRRSNSSSRRQTGHSDRSEGQQDFEKEQHQQTQQLPQAPGPTLRKSAAAAAASVDRRLQHSSIPCAESGAGEEPAAAQVAAAAAATEALLASLQVVQEGRSRRARPKHGTVSSSGSLAGPTTAAATAAAVAGHTGMLQPRGAAEQGRALSWQGGSGAAQAVKHVQGVSRPHDAVQHYKQRHGAAAAAAGAATAKGVTLHTLHAAQRTSSITSYSSGSGCTAHAPPTRQHKSVAVQVGSMNDKAIQVIYDSTHKVLSDGPGSTNSTSIPPAGPASLLDVLKAGPLLSRSPLQGLQCSDPAVVQRALAALAGQRVLLGAGGAGDVTSAQGVSQWLADALAAALAPGPSPHLGLRGSNSTGAVAAAATGVDGSGAQAVGATAAAMPATAAAAAASAAGGMGAGLSQVLSGLGSGDLTGLGLGPGLPLSAGLQQLRTAALRLQLQGLIQRLQQQQQQFGHVQPAVHRQAPATEPGSQQQQQQLHPATSPMLAAVRQVQRLQELRESMGLPVQPGLAMLQQQAWLQQQLQHTRLQEQPLLQTQLQQQQQQRASTQAMQTNGMQPPAHVRFAEPVATNAPVVANPSSTQPSNPGPAVAAAALVVAAAEASAPAATAAAPAASPWFTIPLPGQQQGTGGSSDQGGSGTGQTVAPQTASASPQTSAAAVGGSNDATTATAVAAVEPMLNGSGSTTGTTASSSEQQGWVTLPFLVAPAATDAAGPAAQATTKAAAAATVTATAAAPPSGSTTVPTVDTTAAAAAAAPAPAEAQVQPTAGDVAGGWFSLSLPAQLTGAQAGVATAAAPTPAPAAAPATAAAPAAPTAASAPSCQAEPSSTERRFSLMPAANCSDPATVVAAAAADGGAEEPEINTDSGMQHNSGQQPAEPDVQQTTVGPSGSLIELAERPAGELNGAIHCQASPQVAEQQQQQSTLQPASAAAAAAAADVEVSDKQDNQRLVIGKSRDTNETSAMPTGLQGVSQHAVAADLANGTTVESTLPDQVQALLQLGAACTAADAPVREQTASACTDGPALEVYKSAQVNLAHVGDVKAAAAVAAAGEQAQIQATLQPAAEWASASGSVQCDRQQANSAAATALRGCDTEDVALQAPPPQLLQQQPDESQAQQPLRHCCVTQSQESSWGCLTGQQQPITPAWQSVQQLRQQQEQPWAPRPAAVTYSPLDTLRKYQAFLQAEASRGTGAAIERASAAVLRQQLAQAVSAAEQHKRGYVGVGPALQQLQQVRALLDSQVDNIMHK